jgi:hypothetical protein
MDEDPNLNKNQNFCKYNIKELSEYVLAYNKKFNQYKSKSYVKNVSRKLYFGVLAGGLYGNPETTYSAFILMPSKQSNKNVFYRFGFHSYGSAIFCVSAGIRYAAINGPVRPYIGGAITAAFLSRIEFPLMSEFGAVIPLKKANFFVQSNLYPLRKKVYDFRTISYSAGLFFNL